MVSTTHIKYVTCYDLKKEHNLAWYTDITWKRSSNRLLYVYTFYFRLFDCDCIAVNAPDKRAERTLAFQLATSFSRCSMRPSL